MQLAACGRYFVVAVLALGVVVASATALSQKTGALQISEVHGPRSRSGRQLQQAFGSSSIVPLVIDDSPCVSFNADDASPVLDSEGNIVGYTTVHSNNYDAAGLSILRLDIVVLNFEIEYYFAAVNSSSTNVRATLSTGLPNGCPSTTPAVQLYSQGITVDCAKRRATLDMSVPTSLFNCTIATTEDFSVVFFLQLEAEMAPQQCGASTKPFYAGGLYNAIPFGSGCSYIMVTAACKPSTCVVDTGGLKEEQQLNQALGSTGRIAGGRVQRASSAYDTGLTNVNAAVVGGLVGGVLLSAAVMVGYALLRRRQHHGGAASGHHARRSSVASDYLDADRFDSFTSYTIDAGRAGGGGARQGGGEARRASRLSMSRPSVLLSLGAGRWRDKFGSTTGPTGGAAGAGLAASPSTAGDGSVGDGNQLLSPGASYTPFAGAAAAAAAAEAGGSAGGSTSVSSSPFNARRQSAMFSPRRPSVFAQPRRASMIAIPEPTPSVVLGAPAVPASRARRHSTLVTAPTVPMVLDRAATAAAVPLGSGGPSDGGALPAELAPPDDASSVFLNPLALLRGGGRAAKDRSGSSSPRLLSMSTFTAAIPGFGSMAMRRGSTMVAAPVEDRSDGPLIRMVVEEETQGAGGGSSDGSARQTAVGDGDGGTPPGGGGRGGEATPSPRTQPSIGAAFGGGRPGPVAEGAERTSGDAAGLRSLELTATRPLSRQSAGDRVVLGHSPLDPSDGGLESVPSGRSAAPERTRASESGSLRSILPRPPPLVIPSPVDAAAVAAAVSAAAPAARLARPYRDAAALPSSSQASLQSLRSQGSARSVKSRSPGASAGGDS